MLRRSSHGRYPLTDVYDKHLVNELSSVFDFSAYTPATIQPVQVHLKAAQVDIKGILESELDALRDLKAAKNETLQKQTVEKIHQSSLGRVEAALEAHMVAAKDAFNSNPGLIEEYQIAHNLTDGEAAKQAFSKELDARKKEFLEKYKQEHAAQLAYIEMHFQRMRHNQAIAAALAARKGKIEAITDIEAAKKELNQDTRYKSSDKRFNLWQWFFQGPQSSWIEVSGNRIQFDPRDPNARKAVLDELRAKGLTGTATIKLGSGTVQYASNYSSLSPRFDKKLRDYAMEMWIDGMTGGLEYPHNSDYSTKWTPEKLKQYMREHQYHLPPGFKFPDKATFEEIKIEDFSPTSEEKAILDNTVALAKAIREMEAERLSKDPNAEKYKVFRDPVQPDAPTPDVGVKVTEGRPDDVGATVRTEEDDLSVGAGRRPS